MKTQQPQNSTAVLGQENIGKLFLQTAIPISIGLLVVGFYNLVDGIFIARYVGEDAVGSVSLVFPIQIAISAIGAMISAGTASIITRHIGCSEMHKAGTVAGHALQIAAIGSVLCVFVGWYYIEPILELLSVDAEFYKNARLYLQPIVLTAGVSLFLPVAADFFRAEGKANAMMSLLLTSSILNIVFDYLLIAQFDMGVVGAAYATIIAQFVAILFAVVLYKRNKLDIRITWELSLAKWGPIFALGFPILIAQGSMGLHSALVNYKFSIYGTADWIIAYGMIGRVAGFTFLPLIAMLIAFQTICGFNLGALKLDRVKQSIKVATKYMTAYACVITLLLLLFPRIAMSLFTQDPTFIMTGESLIYSTIWGLPLAGISMIATGFYQAKGHAMQAAFYSGLRVLIILPPLLWLLPSMLGLSGIFIAIVAADLLNSLITLLLCLTPYNRLNVKEEFSVA
ncbi:MATE family efflux transporter [Vibrio sonorensis]|uniref:MATE family efflux transporter n=1 Tax=Vibrio sonorensis TaxID=1004316 RepID=UPI0008DA4B47|nr:MATE family efflux transporter [Vibrio sonorensis]